MKGIQLTLFWLKMFSSTKQLPLTNRKLTGPHWFQLKYDFKNAWKQGYFYISIEPMCSIHSYKHRCPPGQEIQDIHVSHRVMLAAHARAGSLFLYGSITVAWEVIGGV